MLRAKAASRCDILVLIIKLVEGSMARPVTRVRLLSNLDLDASRSDLPSSAYDPQVSWLVLLT